MTEERNVIDEIRARVLARIAVERAAFAALGTMEAAFQIYKHALPQALGRGSGWCSTSEANTAFTDDGYVITITMRYSLSQLPTRSGGAR